MNNENVTSQFLSYFTKLQGKCFFAKYVKDQQFLVKFEYVCEEKKQVLYMLVIIMLIKLMN
jgi:hypothetical protein